MGVEKKWRYNHFGNVIEVQNTHKAEYLFINGEKQDERTGIFSWLPYMQATLNTGETVIAVIGGNFRMHCKIYIDNVLIFVEKG